jgi:hypothetical protein
MNTGVAAIIKATASTSKRKSGPKPSWQILLRTTRARQEILPGPLRGKEGLLTAQIETADVIRGKNGEMDCAVESAPVVPPSRG